MNESAMVGASEAVAMSVADDRIVTIVADEDGRRAAQLLEWSEGTAGPHRVDGGLLTEYWGTRADGAEWRVHLFAAG